VVAHCICRMRGVERGIIGCWGSECLNVHQEARRKLLVNEGKPGQKFTGRYMIRAGVSANWFKE
jgi:hypothetical protein